MLSVSLAMSILLHASLRRVVAPCAQPCGASWSHCPHGAHAVSLGLRRSQRQGYSMGSRESAKSTTPHTLTAELVPEGALHLDSASQEVLFQGHDRRWGPRIALEFVITASNKVHVEWMATQKGSRR